MKQLTPIDILEISANYFDVSETIICENTREREIVRMRQISHYLARKYTKSTLQCIGIDIGGKDHATVKHSIKTIHNLLDVEAITLDDVNNLSEKIKSKMESLNSSHNIAILKLRKLVLENELIEINKLLTFQQQNL